MSFHADFLYFLPYMTYTIKEPNCSTMNGVSKMRILICDDDELMREQVQKYIKS